MGPFREEASKFPPITTEAVAFPFSTVHVGGPVPGGEIEDFGGEKMSKLKCLNDENKTTKI